MKDDYFEPKTASGWIRSLRIPVGNDDIKEGIKYFNENVFYFYEGQAYSEISDFSGYQKLEGGYDDWLEILFKWENEHAPFQNEWKGRTDFSIVSDARAEQKTKLRCGPTNEHFVGDIVQASLGIPYRRGQEISWEDFRDNINLWEVYSDESKKNHKKPEISLHVSVEHLKIPHVKMQSIAFWRDIEANIGHNVRGELMNALINPAKLVVWIETSMKDNDLFWRWCGSVYSWKSVRMISINFCDDSTKSNIANSVMPLVREWSRLVNKLNANKSHVENAITVLTNDMIV